MVSSRVCFKNLPKYADEQKLKEYLEGFSDFTDLKIMKTRDGKSRQFAFVGFKTAAEAKKAVEHFNNSYMDTAKIGVEIAREIQQQATEGQDQQRPWSKYSQGSSAFKKRMREEGGNEKEQPSNKQNKQQKLGGRTELLKSEAADVEDEQFAEFLEVMKPRAKTKLWANEHKKDESKKDDDIQERDQLVMDEEVTDLDYLKSRMKKSKQEKEQEEEEEVDSRRLFIRNVPFDTTETELIDLFEKFGAVSDIHIVQNKITKKSKGTAYIQFSNSDNAAHACQNLNSTSFQGRIIHVAHAKKQAQQNSFTEIKQRNELLNQMGSFKQQKLQNLKDNAGNRETWNALFVRADTVTEAIAAKMGLSKSEFLDKNADDLALRLALGETQIVFDTKKSFEKQGVNINALQAAAAAAGKASKDAPTDRRSRTALLVKNLPFSAEKGELKELFVKYGEISRFILPSTKVLAIVEYKDAQNARKAFRGLAYRKYQHVPLYLEWAPQDIFESENNNDNGTEDQQLPDDKEINQQNQNKQKESNVASVIFVRNLSFNTKDQDFENLFAKAASSSGGSLKSAKIVKRKAPNGGLLSNGYGFVECDSHETAKLVIQQLQEHMLDMHKLKLEFRKNPNSNSNKINDDEKQSEKVSAKLHVKNVPFESERKDIMGLFKPFGNVTSCRLPKKLDGRHKGYAFVNFGTKSQAQNAKNAVHGTHLLGRRLVIEYSVEDHEEQQT